MLLFCEHRCFSLNFASHGQSSSLFFSIRPVSSIRAQHVLSYHLMLIWAKFSNILDKIFWVKYYIGVRLRDWQKRRHFYRSQESITAHDIYNLLQPHLTKRSWVNRNLYSWSPSEQCSMIGISAKSGDRLLNHQLIAPWYLNHMVALNTLRIYEGNKVFFRKGNSNLTLVSM